jgi:long-subunit fatty acid transport protein
MKTLSFRLALPILLGAGLSARAQESPYIGESLNYSRLQFGGPARTQGIAGANVALGADFGNLTSNPAGLGLYQKSELTFTPGLGLGSSDAQGSFGLSGSSQNQQKNSFHIANLGLVIANRRTDDEPGDWRGGSFALGFTRVADYNTAFRYKGQVADDQSFFQRLREPNGQSVVGSLGYNSALDDLDSQSADNTYTSIDGLAYGTFLTSISLGGTSANPVDTLVITNPLRRDRNLPVMQDETVTRNGSMSQFDLGYGGNVLDKFFFGAGIGIVSSNLRQVRTFTETANAGDLSTSFGSVRLNDEVRTRGTGLNARLGVIYKPLDILRIGASIQTPTYIQFTETYNTSLTTRFARPIQIDFNNGSTQTTSGETLSMPSGEYAYTLTTPFRANGGVALTIGKIGFLTGDIEYVGYSQARLHPDPENASGDDYSFSDENEAINTRYTNAVNLRVGAEVRASMVRFRAGYARYGDPYRNGTIDRNQEFYTAGVGFRSNGFFLDLAGVYTSFNQLYSPYSLSSQQEPVVSVSSNRFTTNVTAGFTF